MKIVFLSFYSGVVERGVEVWVKELSKRLQKKYDVTIYKGQSMDIDWSYKDYSNSFKRRIYLDYWGSKICEFTKKTLKNINKDSLDIIIPTNGGWQSLLCKFYAKINRKKVVMVGHSGIGWDDRINLITRPNVFVTLSNHQKKWAERNGFGVRIEKIPDGVDLNKFTPSGEKISLNLQQPIILVVSSLSDQKRVDLAIKAVSNLKRGSLIVLGKGDEKQTEKIHKMGKALLGDRFLLTNDSHNETPKWYRASDIVTFPTFSNEAFGMVLLEAMACNKPVIATDDPIRREIVGEAGLFCDPSDSDRYAQTLVKALNTNFSDKPRIQAEKFGWDKIVAQYEELFKSL